MAQSMEDGCGIYRSTPQLTATCDKLAQLKQRWQRAQLDDRSRAWNTEWLAALELGFQLDVAQTMAHAALARRESRGAHQRLDEGCGERDDVRFLKHSLARCDPSGGAPHIGWAPVTITRSPPGKRAYGAAAHA
jgi:fumarate reductase flavoprotein subunit